ncbi:DUF502 domain-containing protein [uncultured Shimia sp.]|uniref:DUF502 domain-containing protein n=1 Tax=uncultured Shimia sp. TaxID=573152 RepID=UPI00260C79FC|nr:DUF502 domain-containing protein [uncultured Shimia sp.]
MTTPFDDDPHPHRRHGRFAGLRASFLTGIVVIAPVAMTIWLIWTLIGWFDGFVLPLVPETFQPKQYVGNNLPGVGVVIFLIFTVVVGWIAKGLIGRSMIGFAEGLVDRMPIVRSIYSGVKQIAETVFAQSDRNFEKACLIEYPRKDIWVVGFVSTSAKGEVADSDSTGEELMGVFVPTTPNPTSGFLLFLPKKDIIELEMSIEEAAKLVISAGLVYPNAKDPTAPPDTED